MVSSVNRLFHISPFFARWRLPFQVAAFSGVTSRQAEAATKPPRAADRFKRWRS